MWPGRSDRRGHHGLVDGVDSESQVLPGLAGLYSVEEICPVPQDGLKVRGGAAGALGRHLGEGLHGAVVELVHGDVVAGPVVAEGLVHGLLQLDVGEVDLLADGEIVQLGQLHGYQALGEEDVLVFVVEEDSVGEIQGQDHPGFNESDADGSGVVELVASALELQTQFSDLPIFPEELYVIENLD